ncbi:MULTISPECIES: inorganic phosphate transporter [Microbacterium]|uniref:inorganic phosphate transporter n=1 Tax=Microbacterium TaxID=33882 RepID=UPI00217D728E|nr:MULTISPECIES: inorganic phosphate transporter [Microbacterium]UWF77945.1 inorganic phosphate transporter [Microbacterium neungamense]WCM56122.1 inorganic phosphate transporter [Microbacterium sp. EF45047]
MSTDKTTTVQRSERRFLGDDRWWHVAFGLILAITLTVFVLWSFGVVDEGANRLVLVTAIGFGLFMAFNIGGNDVANSFGTSVGAGTLSMKQALMVAAVFEVGGAVIAGGEVTDTVRSGIVDLSGVAIDPMDFVVIMMSALLGAAVWLLIATRMGWPVSTTHSIIGGIVGAAVTTGFLTGTGGFEMVQWDQIGQIAISWVLSPVLGGAVAWLLFGGIKRFILVYNERADQRMREIKQRRIEHRTSHRTRFERLSEVQQLAYTNAMARDAAAWGDDVDPDELESEYFKERYALDREASAIDAHRALETGVPLLAAFGAIVITSMLMFKALHLDIDSAGTFLIIAMIGAAVWLAVFIFARTLKHRDLERSTFLLFSWMQVFTACAFAFSHGSNDIANAIGPFAAVLDVLQSGEIDAEAPVPPQAMLAFGIALVVGLWFIGRAVIKTVGEGLTKMHPASGFAAELSAAGVVMAASLLGLPVSSTHILIGAVLGVGLVNGAANWRLMRPIGLAWVITLPAAAAIGALGVVVLPLVLGI